MTESLSQYDDFDDAEVASYIAWIEEQDQAEEPTEALPCQLTLDPEAQYLHDEVSGVLAGLTEKLESAEVRRKTYWEEGGEHSVLGEMQAYQAAMLPEVFKHVRFESDALSMHTSQESPVSCQPTCIQNALHCFGVEVTQAEIAQACRFDHHAMPPFPGQMMDYVRNNGFVVEVQKSVFDMINSLVDGAKIVVDLGQPTFPVEHAILVTGVRIEDGAIDFIINDPANTTAQTLPLDVMLQRICPNQYRVLSPTYSINRPQDMQ